MIKLRNLGCDSDRIIYLLYCKIYSNQHVGSCINRFRECLESYRICHRGFCHGHTINQGSFAMDRYQFPED